MTSFEGGSNLIQKEKKNIFINLKLLKLLTILVTYLDLETVVQNFFLVYNPRPTSGSSG